MWKKKHDPYDDDYPWKENFEEEEKSKTAATWSPFASFLMKVFIPIFVISAILSTIGFFIYNARLAFYSGMVCTISFAIWSGAFMSFKDNTGATYFYDEILYPHFLNASSALRLRSSCVSLSAFGIISAITPP